MWKRKTLPISIACLAAAIALAALHGGGKEPMYQGRSISDWLRQPEPLGYPDDSKLSPETHHAIRSIGTNAIPVALRWISYEPSPFTPKLVQLIQNFAPVIGTTSMAKGDNLAFRAENVFAILATDARTAIPELTRLAIRSRSETRVFRCARALVEIGPEGASGLIGIISAPNCKARWAAAAFISLLGSNAAPAIPILLQSTNDKDDRLACAANESLGEIALSPSLVIPALISTLHCTNAHRRASAARGLAGFGPAAASAAAELHQALTDASPAVREQATNALLRIAPDTTGRRRSRN